ncbi:U6 snRNA phosphodiesterase-like isoform X2 [Nilaparvata lugens]|uniref:U6 snRNA phosphodiesterase-like isoform X2 n=1 Tax=Nilaparvata lugens TaxID=108931 RepID=UPI00193D936E|nr:U6 snRNA phosphodiesterase-like isoform X2 [Nilaparvata lugens]
MDDAHNQSISSGLALISNYESEDCDSDEENEVIRLDKSECNTSRERLPAPSALLQTTKTEDFHEDNPLLHDGRVRSFPHVRGNWSTLVYIAYEHNDVLDEFITNLKLTLGDKINLRQIDNLHISLSKTVVLLYHWINTLVESLQLQFQTYPRFTLQFGELEVFCNETETRTFIGMNILAGNEELLNLVKMVDSCLTEFKLDTFYEDILSFLRSKQNLWSRFSFRFRSIPLISW